ncbi:hypothetical protein [Mycobacterium sp. ITM-2016-00318]|uniref:hypothetical protein n=1 Tax=Mycobacterium sp. ITM-2016-00318 TaxID=2099693 RepID=UPI000CF8D76C|nr:hypothetical protein [Mycobacterium sp. ITM-2016-00318]WNG91079.1 hypothetical protein C6A82_016290 [Mycobacterium sp. ITM-2016-00318]
MTEKRDSTTAPTGQDHRRTRALLPVRRFALGVATGAVLAVSLLAACGGDSTEWDTLTVNQHLYLNGPDGTKFEISVGKDASGQDVVTATRIGE